MKPTGLHRQSRLLALGLLMVLLLAACGGGAVEETTAPTDDAASDAPQTETATEPAAEGDGGTSEAAADLPEVCQGQDGSGLTVGFANIGESVPFAVIVREGIEEVAAECNLSVVSADNQLDPQQALSNARNFVSQGVDGVIEFQVHEDVSGAVCDILTDLPVIAIDIAHPECAVFMGADNRTAGELTGNGTGERVEELWDCDVDQIVTFEAFGVGQVNIDRLNGSIAGLQDVCPDLAYGDFEEWAPSVTDSIITRLDADRVDPAFEQGRDYLTAHPEADHIVALCINEDSCLGFRSAVQEAGRDGQVIFGSNGADPTSHDAIRSDEYYAGATAFFPERYGELLVPNIVRMINGEEPEADPLLVDHVFVSEENIDEVYPAGAAPEPADDETES
jgi:ribose transport system substrate-binding protein